MKSILTKSELRVLSAMQLDSRTPSKEISRVLQMKQFGVDYAKQRLRDKGALSPYLLLNPHALGLIDFCMFFRTEATEKNAREKIIQLCNQVKHISYLVELGGQYQWSVSLFASSVSTVEEFLLSLSEALPKTIFTSIFSIRTEWTIFGGKIGDVRSIRRHQLRRASNVEKAHVDSVDIKIINHLSGTPESSNVSLAAALKISEPTVRRRLKDLKTRGIVLGFPVAINPELIGLIPYRVLIRCRHNDETLKLGIFAFCKAHPLITEFVRCLGGWEFEINFLSNTHLQAGELIHELYTEFGDRISATELLSEIKIHKLHRFVADLH